MSIFNFIPGRGGDKPKKTTKTEASRISVGPEPKYYLKCRHCDNIQDEFNEDLECLQCYSYDSWAVKDDQGKPQRYDMSGNKID